MAILTLWKCHVEKNGEYVITKKTVLTVSLTHKHTSLLYVPDTNAVLYKGQGQRQTRYLIISAKCQTPILLLLAVGVGSSLTHKTH